MVLEKINPVVLKIGTMLGYGAAGFVGVFCILTCEFLDVKLKLVMVYLPVFTFLGLLSELSISAIDRKFGFLASFYGKSIFIIFLGSLCMLAGGISGYVVGAYMVALGVVMFFLRTRHPDNFIPIEKAKAGSSGGDVEDQKGSRKPKPKKKSAGVKLSAPGLPEVNVDLNAINLDAVSLGGGKNAGQEQPAAAAAAAGNSNEEFNYK